MTPVIRGSRDPRLRLVHITIIRLSILFLLVGVFTVGLCLFRPWGSPRGIPSRLVMTNQLLTRIASPRELFENHVTNGLKQVTNGLFEIKKVVVQAFETAMAAYQPTARGGFGDVYKIHVPSIGYFALKRVTNCETDERIMKAAVARENRFLARLDHPNIVRSPPGSDSENSGYIVTYWAENGTLRNYLDKNPDADRLQILCDVASGLRYLHCGMNQIIHGDIYVDNVLISESGTALLNDFGMSTVVFPDMWPFDGQGNSGRDYLLGRAAYEAPERHDDPPARRSLASDVFAFGMLVFHTYAGTPPFASLGNPAGVVVAIYEGRRPARSEITRNDFPDTLWELVEECWRHDPKDRPTMARVKRRLMRLLTPSENPSRPNSAKRARKNGRHIRRSEKKPNVPVPPARCK